MVDAYHSIETTTYSKHTFSVEYNVNQYDEIVQLFIVHSFPFYITILEYVHTSIVISQQNEQ